MRQYHGIKQQVPHALLMFRLGDFYELFYEDAVTAARELEITLTSRHKDSAQPVPMCGVPFHAAENYIARLIQKGYRVAICDQMEVPTAATKLVRREVTRIVTPGTTMNASILRAHENNYLGAIFVNGARAGVAHADVTTGEFRATEIPLPEAVMLLETLGAREVLVPTGITLETPGTRTEIESWIFGRDYAERSLCDHFKLASLDGCGLQDRALAIGAGAALLHYLRDTQRAALEHLEPPRFYDRSDALLLDASTVRNLELVDPLFQGESRESTLLSVLDRTRTGMGGRMLRQRLLVPSLDLAEINARLDAVDEYSRATIGRGEMAKELVSILDLERLLARVSIATAGPRDLSALARSLAIIPRIKPKLEPMKCTRLGQLFERLDEVSEVAHSVLNAISDEPPVNLNDGGAIRDGYDVALDELRDISRNSKTYLAQIELRERQRTGITSLKVRFNNVFGYYIEISKANLHLAPADYDRKQTLVNAERFTTPELKELEAKILDAEDKILSLEREIFERLRVLAVAHAGRIKSTAAAIAELDLTIALAEVAADLRYTRPHFSDTGEMQVVAARHPVIEKLAAKDAQQFIANDIYFHPDSEFIALITGPKMGGKSTYLRQAALLIILAQMGSFVPAESALLPLVDRVFTRIGAADNLARGRSTFMVEMTETAAILNTATSRSLIILDEIGRGTSTYDGLALAWAVVEHIHQRIRAKTLFATHYHELTELASLLEGVRNLRVSVKEADDQILFLRKVEPGAADRSYGIEVARLAGLPLNLIERAREILKKHETAEHQVSEELTGSVNKHHVQIQMFEPVIHTIADRIRTVNVDELRPIEALQLLAELQKELKKELG